MSKVLEATCVAGIVKVGALPITDTEILSEGEGASEGVIILQEDKRYYLAKTSGDLKEALDRLSSALGDLTSALTAIDTKSQATTCLAGPGVTVPTPVAASSIASIVTAHAAIDVLRGMLR